MNRFVRFYNQNRKVIWITLLLVVGVITLIQILDRLVKEKNINEVTNNVVTPNITNKNYSVITGEENESNTSKIIDEFINYCNNQQIEKAYELLSDECKEILYPTLNEFEKKYHSKIFTEKKTYLYQAWISNSNTYTYKVDFVDNILATGTASKTSICDYYTVVENNDTYKLNINKFIDCEDINKLGTKNNITINIKRKKIYIDYETYEIEVKNDNQKDLMLDDLLHTKTIYVEDYKEQKYFWNNYEFIESDVTIEKGNKQNINIKFNKAYTPKYETMKIVFSNIKINSEETIQIDVLI